eukprot:3678001-Amphidinium_carterae.1
MQRQQLDVSQEEHQSRLVHEEYQASRCTLLSMLNNGTTVGGKHYNKRPARSIPSPELAVGRSRLVDRFTQAEQLAFTRGQARRQHGVQMAALRSEVTQVMTQATDVHQEMQALCARRDQLQTEVAQL